MGIQAGATKVMQCFTASTHNMVQSNRTICAEQLPLVEFNWNNSWYKKPKEQDQEKRNLYLKAMLCLSCKAVHQKEAPLE